MVAIWDSPTGSQTSHHTRNSEFWSMVSWSGSKPTAPSPDRKIFTISTQQWTEPKIIHLNISKATSFLLEQTLTRSQLLAIPTDMTQLSCRRPQLSLGDFRSLELCLVAPMNVFLHQMENMLQRCQVNHTCVTLANTQTWKAHIVSCAKRAPTAQNKETTADHVQNTHFQAPIGLLASLMISSQISATICIIWIN